VSIATAVLRRYSTRVSVSRIPCSPRTGGVWPVTVASSEGSDIWIIDLDRGARTRLTTDNASASPVWSPDGARVAFQSTAPGPWNLYWKDVDGGAETHALLSSSAPSASAWSNTAVDVLPGTLPTLTGANPQFPTSWGGNPGALAFHERKANGERDIWVVVGGGDPSPFLLTRFDERSPTFSPDGTCLAYVSDESGRDEVYVQPYPGPGRKYPISTHGGTDPVWSPSGRELFYRQGDDLMAVPVARTPEFSAGRPQRQFHLRFDRGDNGPNYDVSPDGRWFIMPRREDAPAAGTLHLVFNWVREVAERTRGPRQP
jgi:serine/threonine-protein kinase